MAGTADTVATVDMAATADMVVTAAGIRVAATTAPVAAVRGRSVVDRRRHLDPHHPSSGS